MKYCGTLIAVKDMAKSKYFYETVLEQKVVMDLDVHVAFESGLSLQSNFAELVGENLMPATKEDNFELYFEVEDIESCYAKMQELDGVELLHGIKEYPWGQKVMRLYDYDKHILEIAESMVSVIIRFLKQGLSIDETAKRSMFPREVVEKIASGKPDQHNI